MRWSLLFPRVVLLLPLAATLVALLATSSLHRLFPVPPALLLAYASGAVALALLPALFAEGSTLPGTMAVLVPVLAVASYEESRLDWLRLLKDYGVAAPGAPDLVRLALGAIALLLAWGVHVTDTSMRLRTDAAERGLPPEMARAAGRRVRAAGGRLAGTALVGTSVAGVLAVVAARIPLGAFASGRASLVAPLLAVGLLAAGAALLWVDRARREQS